MTRKQPPAPLGVAEAMAAAAARFAAQSPSGLLPSEEAERAQAAKDRKDLMLKQGIRDRDPEPAEPEGKKRKRPKPAKKERPRVLSDKHEGHRDWQAIRAQYVFGDIDAAGNRTFPSTEDLALRHGLSHSAVRGQANRTSWAEARRQFTAEMEELAAKRAKELISKFASDFEQKVSTVANAAVIKAAQYLGDQKLSPGNFAAVMGGLRQAVTIARLAMGQPDQITANQVTVSEADGTGIKPTDLAEALVAANRRLQQTERALPPTPADGD